jgi:hypothetical protein
VTEDSQNRVRGYGPFPEGAEPTEQISAQNAAAPPDGEDAAAPPDGEDAATPRDGGAASLPPEPQEPTGPEPQEPTGPEPREPTGPEPQEPTGIYGSPAGPWLADPRPQSALPDDGTTTVRSDSGPAPYGPFHNDPDPSFGFSAPPGRRIEPSPPRQRSRLPLGLAIGLLAGLLIFGTAGWLTGRATAPTETATTPATPTASVFEQNQIRINTPDFQGTGLTTLAKGWLPYIATCNRTAPTTLSQGEKTRVRCTLDGMSALFVEYTSVAERDKARAKTVSQAADARELTPGVAKPTQRPTPSNRTTGNYVEYAYRLTERGVTRTVSGIWWDDAKTPVAGYLLAYWKDGVGESWEPMRDLWSRYA